MLTDRDRIVNSALWAAFGDAMGFIAEGTDQRGFRRRLRDRTLGAIEWTRKIGRTGPEVTLPAGTYSDDTQLRLATSRAIDARGNFDVDAFSAIELPAFLEYALGAGLGTLSSARRLKQGAKWNAMFKGSRDGRYERGGGNGAAMRIQPHVWACSRGDDSYLQDIVRNAACTHGHPKAFVGAIFHAKVLRIALNASLGLSFQLVSRAAEDLEDDVDVLYRTPELGRDWVREWDRATASSFADQWKEACGEIKGMLATLPGTDRGNVKGYYRPFLEKHGLLAPAERGSATKTAAAAAAAILILDDTATERMLKIIASELDSDTDTIATMAGAILGAHRPEAPVAQVLDREYIESEAVRSASIASHEAVNTSFDYGTQAEPVEGAVMIGKLGPAYLSDGLAGRGPHESYRWARLRFGQTVLVRRKEPARRHAPSLFESVDPLGFPDAEMHTRSMESAQFDQYRILTNRNELAHDPAAIAKRLAENGFNYDQIGRYLLNCSRYAHGEGLAASIAVELVKMYRRQRMRVTEKTTPVPAKRNGDALRATIAMQLSGTSRDGRTKLEGFIANYGRAAAGNVTVAFGADRPSLQFDLIEPEQRQDIEQTVAVSIEDGTPVDVTFRSDGAMLRQRGRFEVAVGRQDVLLLKGLGLSEMLREPPRP